MYFCEDSSSKSRSYGVISLSYSKNPKKNRAKNMNIISKNVYQAQYIFLCASLPNESQRNSKDDDDTYMYSTYVNHFDADK